MFGFDTNTQKSIGQVREEIDRTIMLHCWAQIAACPACGCNSELSFTDRTNSEETSVEVECELCNAVLQQIVGDVEIGL